MKKILVIDDDKSVKNFLDERISDFGGERDVVEYALSGEEGVKKYKDIRPMFVFIDMKMPGISGLETFQMIRNFDQYANVFIVTGYTDELTNEAIKLGAKGYISKSVDYIAMMASLVIAVDKAMSNT